MVDVAVVERTVAEKKRSVSITPERMSLSEMARQEWVATAEFGTLLTDLTKPEFFAHMAQRMQIYDHVEVIAEDGSWIADLIIMNKGSNWTQNHIKYKHEFKAEEVQQGLNEPEYRISWKGPHLMFCVERIADNARIKEKMTREEAQLWLRDFEKDRK